MHMRSYSTPEEIRAYLEVKQSLWADVTRILSSLSILGPWRLFKAAGEYRSAMFRYDLLQTMPKEFGDEQLRDAEARIQKAEGYLTAVSREVLGCYNKKDHQDGALSIHAPRKVFRGSSQLTV